MATHSLLAARDGADPDYYRAGSALSRILLEAPYLARCSDDKTATRVRPRQYAVSYPYAQINRPGMVSWLIFDLDHSDPYLWESVGLPAPNLIVQNRTNGHSHLFWAIEPVCTTERARSRPIAYMRAIYAAMATRLRADPQFASGPVAKVPGHPWWLTRELHPKVHTLGDLAEYVDLPVPRRRVEDQPDVPHSRHCILFTELRWVAYVLVGKARAGHYEAFYDQILAHAHVLNNFASRGFGRDLALSSLRSTAKSVARWTWEHYTGSGSQPNRGVMQLDSSLPLAERQRLAAERSTRLRQRGTEARIRAAVARLAAGPGTLTLSAVARVAGVSRQTVARHRELLAKPDFPLQAQSQRPVAFGVHQVSAGPLPESVGLPSGLRPGIRVAQRLLDASSPSGACAATVSVPLASPQELAQPIGEDPGGGSSCDDGPGGDKS